jgi:hypothetical protein
VLLSAKVSVPPVPAEGFTTLVLPAPYNSLLPVTVFEPPPEPELPVAHATTVSPVSTAHAVSASVRRRVMSGSSPFTKTRATRG